MPREFPATPPQGGVSLLEAALRRLKNSVRFGCGFAAWLVLAAGLAAPAVSRAAPPARAGACEVRAGDVSFFRDQGLTVKVGTKLQFNKVLMRERIEAKVSGGVAILSGNVSSAEMVSLAGRLAADTAGIRCVQNYLKVGPPLAAD